MYCPFSAKLERDKLPVIRECDYTCALFITGSGCAFKKIAQELEKQSKLKDSLK